MKVTFIYPDVVPHVVGWTGYFHYGISSLSAVLKGAGHQTSLIHITRPISAGDFIERVRAADADLLALSSTSHMFPHVKRYVRWLRQEGVGTPAICGGVHPTIAAEESIAVDGLDMICRGEGEYALLELCNAMRDGADITRIPNIWLKRDGNVFRNPLRPVEYNLDRLPFADRELFDYRSLYNERQGIACFLASRGCPFSCTYCCNQLKKSIYGTEGKPVRFRSVDNLLREIKQVLQASPFIRKLNFDDDILLLEKKWSGEFADRYSSEVGLPFMCNARADITNEARVELLRRSGCYYVRLGLESGNEDIRFTVLNRHMSNAQISRAFRLCKKAGMITHAYNIVGIPNETPAAILDTIKLNAQVGVDVTHVSIFQPYPGTKLAEMCRAQNLLGPGDLADDFCSSSVLRLKGLSSAQVLMFRDYFRAFVLCYRMFWRLPALLSRFVIRLFDRCLSAKVTANLLNAVYLPCNYLYRRIDLGLRARQSPAR